MTDVNTRRREWVNEEFAEQTEGSSMSNKQKTKLLKRLWKQAKRDIK